MKRFFLLLSCVALPLLVGGISGFFTVDGVKGWYQTLIKPGFTPPNYLFGPVWSFLYAFMGVAFFRIVEKPPGADRTLAIRLFWIQLFFNFCWSVLFFSMHLITAALVDIVVLWGFIVWMIFQFRKLDAFAGYSQIPYLLWVSFATALTASIWWLNG